MKNKLITAIAAIIAAALACWGGYVFCTQVTFGENAELYALIPVYIILVLLGAVIEDVVHEGAHFLVGAACSMGVKLPKIRIFRSSSIDVFPRGAKRIKARFILTAGAGLFFDLLLIILGVIALAVPSVPALFGITLPYAVYSFIINAAPFEYAAGKTDGCVIWEAITKAPSSQVMFAVLKVQGMVNSGVFMQEVPEEILLDVPQLPEDDINFIILTQLRYEYYLAKGDDSTAYKYFLRYRDLIKYLPSEYKDDKSSEKWREKIRKAAEEQSKADEATTTLDEISEQVQTSTAEVKIEDLKAAEDKREEGGQSAADGSRSEGAPAEQPETDTPESQPAADTAEAQPESKSEEQPKE